MRKHKAAKAGDQTPIWIVITVLIVCAGILAWIMIRRKK
ncbi:MULTISPECIES: LPXTG cell wall anchor domain-containing protein [Dorea]|nr:MULTISPECIES: LPXTG cell wall anchor domain-containing protein [Dorea]MBT9721029.1 LPXTG cell wall anchor domain-containing protein [Dorea longicatena]MCB5501222.1 LPXTG cell wall anchor domain-containing protein [Dorea formicigenerans]MDR3791420.1 LPXTG cell wall anchor domain-containing protein [Dorea sp.]